MMRGMIFRAYSPEIEALFFVGREERDFGLQVFCSCVRVHQSLAKARILNDFGG